MTLAVTGLWAASGTVRAMTPHLTAALAHARMADLQRQANDRRINRVRRRAA
jgi:hypothetical protein